MGTFGTSRVFGALVVAALLLPAPAHAAQLDVREFPEVTGPLSLVSRICGREDPTRDGEVIAVTRHCIHFYAFDPAYESDLTTDYGVAWFQTSVDARRGWCARVVNSDIQIPDGAEMLDRTPPRSYSVSRPRTRVARLALDDDVKAVAPATIAQDFILRPRNLRSFMRADAKTFRLRWEGRTGRKIAFAMGMKISWTSLGLGQPPDSFLSGLSYRFKRRARC